MTNETRDDSRIRANDQDVASKVVDGEAILINLTNGMYYSMDSVSGFVWSMIMQGGSVDTITSAVTAHYSVQETDARTDVRRLVEELLEEGLIIVEDGSADPIVIESVSPSPQAYEPPALTRYDDMADMFALDPPLPELPPVPQTDPD